MSILKLLNKNYLTFFCFFLILLNSNSFSNEPVDIWKIESTQENDGNFGEIETKKKNNQTNSIYETITNGNNSQVVFEDKDLDSNEIEIVGLYDPEENDLTIDMWSNSNGEDILWASKGTLSVGGTAYSWSTAYQIEGSAIAEIKVYSATPRTNNAKKKATQ